MRYRTILPPWQHQRWALKRLWRQGSALLWADTGTGKTKIVIDYAVARALRGDLRRMLVVCPLSAVGVWRNEMTANAPPDLLTYLGTRNDWEKLAEVTAAVRVAQAKALEGLSVLVVTYETVTRYLKLLTNFKPHLLVYDESQYLRNYGATRTRRALSLARSAGTVICASGTPAPKGYRDLYWQLKMVHPGILPPTVAEFDEQYIQKDVFGQIRGYTNVKDLARRISPVVIRIPKSVLKLPSSIDQVVPIILSKAERMFYNRLAADAIAVIDGEEVSATNQLVQFLRLSQATGGFVKTQEGKVKQLPNASKLQVLLERLEAETGKVVVFCRFLDEIAAIVERLKSSGISTDSITGSTSGARREQIVRAFQTQPDPKVLVLEIRAGGVAITLTAAAVAYYYSLDFDSEVYEQSRGRIYRGGQTQSCRFVHLLAEDTIDEKIYQAVRQKMSTQALLGELVKACKGHGPTA